MIPTYQFLEITGSMIGSLGFHWRYEDNPRRLGKDRVRLVGPVPPTSSKCGAREEAGFTGSSDGGRAPSVRESGTRRSGAIRNRSELSQLAAGSFDPQ